MDLTFYMLKHVFVGLESFRYGQPFGDYGIVHAFHMRAQIPAFDYFPTCWT